MALADVYSLSIYAWCVCADVYVALMTFINFSSVTMVLAVDAGHQMKR
jgi:hypothetical protein